mgnify:CR=1 FL=1
MSYEILKFPHFAESRGTLTPFEFDAEFPFAVKRVYTVTGNAGSIRGAHAHTQESEIFVVVAGSVPPVVDDGETCEEIVLDHPSKALYVQTMCWHEFKDFSPEAVLLCFSSTHYLPGEQNYIIDRDEFYNLINKMHKRTIIKLIKSLSNIKCTKV